MRGSLNHTWDMSVALSPRWVMSVAPIIFVILLSPVLFVYATGYYDGGVLDLTAVIDATTLLTGHRGATFSITASLGGDKAFPRDVQTDLTTTLESDRNMDADRGSVIDLAYTHDSDRSLHSIREGIIAATLSEGSDRSLGAARELVTVLTFLGGSDRMADCLRGVQGSIVMTMRSASIKHFGSMTDMFVMAFGALAVLAVAVVLIRVVSKTISGGLPR